MTFTTPEPAPKSLADIAADFESAQTPEPVETVPAEPVPTGSVPAIEPSRHLSTQTEYPWRTALVHGGGTAIAVLVAFASILGDGHVQGFIARYVPGQAAGVLAFGVFCGTLAGVLSRIANLTKVAALRTRLGIGPIPKH